MPLPLHCSPTLFLSHYCARSLLPPATMPSPLLLCYPAQVICEVPLFVVAPWLSRRLSAPAMLLIAMACYVVQVAVYVCISDPRYVLFVEPLHGVTFSLMNIATVAEASRLAPPHLQATGQAFISVVRTVGTIVGTVGGSAVMQWAGSTVAYGVAGVLVATAAVVYGLVAWIERRHGGVVGVDLAD